MFKLNGSDISGAQIESGLILHPDVKEAGVVPVTLSVYTSISDQVAILTLPKQFSPGEEEPAPYGFIVKKPRSNLTVDEFVQWMAQELTANMKLYGGVSFIDALPLSTVRSEISMLCILSSSDEYDSLGIRRRISKL